MSLFKYNVSDLTHLICWIPFYIQVSLDTSLIPLWKLLLKTLKQVVIISREEIELKKQWKNKWRMHLWYFR